MQWTVEVTKELDFHIEAANMTAVADNLQHMADHVILPRIVAGMATRWLKILFPGILFPGMFLPNYKLK